MKVLILITSVSKYANHNIATGLWLSELTHFYDECLQNKIEVTIASTIGGKISLDPESLKPLALDKLTKKYFSDVTFMKLLDNTTALSLVNSDDYNAVYLTGGHGTMYDFVGNSILNDMIRKLYENGKIVAAICHGVCGLIDVKLSNGAYLVSQKNITGYSWLEEIIAQRNKQVPFNLQQMLKNRGAFYEKAFIPLTSKVVQDKNLITGQNPFSSKKIAKKVMELLMNKSNYL